MHLRVPRATGRCAGPRVAFVLVALVHALPASDCGAESLLLEDGHFPSWTPDGGALACNRIQGATHDAEIFAWSVPASGGPSDTLLVDSSGVLYPQWLPDGQRLVYHRTRSDGNESIYEFVVHDFQGSPAVVWPAPNFWHDASFRLSPDGTRVVYTTLVGGRTLWALDLASGSSTALRPGSGGAISPDGQRIAFTIRDSVAVAPLGGGPERALEPGYGPCWTPDGRALVFSGIGPHGHLDLVFLELESGKRQTLTDDPDLDLRSSVSPDGRKVVFVKTLDDDYGPFNLWLLDLGTTAVCPATWSDVKRAFQ